MINKTFLVCNILLFLFCMSIIVSWYDNSGTMPKLLALEQKVKDLKSPSHIHDYKEGNVVHYPDFKTFTKRHP